MVLWRRGEVKPGFLLEPGEGSGGEEEEEEEDEQEGGGGARSPAAKGSKVGTLQYRGAGQWYKLEPIELPEVGAWPPRPFSLCGLRGLLPGALRAAPSTRPVVRLFVWG